MSLIWKLATELLITQRSAAAALASLWRETGDICATYTHWYWQWNDAWGAYPAAENLSSEDRDRLRELKVMLEMHPFVAAFHPEDDGLLGE